MNEWIRLLHAENNVATKIFTVCVKIQKTQIKFFMMPRTLDTTVPHPIILFLHWRSLTIDLIVIKASFFVPLYHLTIGSCLAGGWAGSNFPYILLNEIQTMFLQFAEQSSWQQLAVL